MIKICSKAIFRIFFFFFWDSTLITKRQVPLELNFTLQLFSKCLIIFNSPVLLMCCSHTELQLSLVPTNVIIMSVNVHSLVFSSFNKERCVFCLFWKLECLRRNYWEPLLKIFPECIATSPCPPSLSTHDTSSLWHVYWLFHCQRCTGPWLMW